MHCIYLSVSPLHITIDLMEQGRDEPLEPAPVEAANPEQDQGKPRSIQPYHWVLFIILSYLWLLDVH
jgi:hypothetical protein